MIPAQPSLEPAPPQLPSLEQVLELFVITYNRANYLDRTLEQFRAGPFAGCKLTVLDNCSTDETPAVCRRHEELLPNLKVIRHKKNIGLSANYLRAVELSESPYTWVLCDDDQYDFSDCQDVLDAVLSGRYDFVSVGAPGQEGWSRGQATTSRELIRQGLKYHLVFTFVGGLIFRTERFDSEAIAKGYQNAGNLYPHFPFINKSVRDNFSIYISRRFLVVRDSHAGPPSHLYWLMTAVNSCRTIEDPRLRRKAVYDAADSPLGWLKSLTIAILTEKATNPKRVGPELAQIALGLSPDQLLLLALASPTALVPPPAARFLWKGWRAVRGKAEVPPAAEPYDPLRV